LSPRPTICQSASPPIYLLSSSSFFPSPIFPSPSPASHDNFAALHLKILENESKENNRRYDKFRNICTICPLGPVTPTEATFEETDLTGAFTFDYTTLAPVTPVEADFSDVVPEKNADMTILAPVTPLEADFNENIEDLATDFSALAPVTPSEADFE
jgi:hypothetical protein